jgi:hypothetical protein
MSKYPRELIDRIYAPAEAFLIDALRQEAEAMERLAEARRGLKEAMRELAEARQERDAVKDTIEATQ